MWLTVLLLVILAGAALIFFMLWRKALRAQAAAERLTAQAQTATQAQHQTCEQTLAQLTALHLAETDAIVLISTERQIVRLNPAAKEVFGARAAPGQTLILASRSFELDLLAEHALAGGADLDRQISLNGQPYRARIAVTQPNGQHGAIIILRDLSELQRLGRARRDFVANISHELRTPITSIRLLVDTLRGGAVQDAAFRGSLLEKIAIEAEALGQLAQELLDLSQIESGQMPLRLISLPARTLLENAATRLAEQQARKRHTLTIVCDPNLIVLADPELVGRAIVNLLHNAIKFTPDAGHIELSAQAEGEMAHLSVRDSGDGIATHDLPRIFERFYRADRSRQKGGTGLGLAIAKHMVEAHGGRLWAESTGLTGQGAVFHLTLPVDDAQK